MSYNQKLDFFTKNPLKLEKTKKSHVWILIAILTIWLIALLSLLQEHYYKNGIQTTAKIEHVSPKNKSQFSKCQNSANYSYEDNNLQKQVGTIECTNDLKEGDIIEIEYLSSNSAQSHIKKSARSWLVFTMTVGFLIIPIGFLYLLQRKL